MDSLQRRKAGIAVAARMHELGTSADAVARAAGTSGATIRAVMRGHRWPHTATRSRIEIALGWAVGELDQRAEGSETPYTLGEYPETQLLTELLRRHEERERIAGR